MHVVSRGYRISYSAYGAAEPTIVLLHGHLQAAEDWVNAGYPDFLVPTHRVIAIDQLGYGSSDKPHDVNAHLLDGRVADVSAVLDAEEVERAVLWGYSMGVATAEAFAKQHPGGTTAVIAGGNLVNASPDDRQNLGAADADRLAQSGVRAFIEEFWPFMKPEATDLFVSRNDPLAASAAAKGTCAPHLAENAPLPSATINYMGTDEPWFELVKAVAAEKGVTFEALPGDHSTAFQGAEQATAMVRSFLAQNDPDGIAHPR